MLVVTTLRLGLLFALVALAAGQFRALLPSDNPDNGNCNSTACHAFVPGGGLSFR